MKCKIAFFGTPSFAVTILDKLKKEEISPELIITAPDRPQGRGLKMTPPPVKVWAEKNNIEYLQPEKLDSEFISKLLVVNCELFIVAAYGKILPESILEIPKYGVLNVHPSLLPKYRGPSPIEGVILAGEKETGVSIMKLDEEMDHGPILKQTTYNLQQTTKASALEKELAHIGGKLLALVIPDWIVGKIKTKEQNHNEASYTRKIEKLDGLLDLDGNSEENYRKYLAYDIWPRTYFFTERNGKNIRVIIKEATLENGVFKIKRVIPEGGKETSYEKM